jgi:hypothetical protein
MNREEIRDLLKNNICEVTFTKINGEQRIMPCTLLESEVPKINATSEKSKVSEETLSVWCLDKKQWRSFRVANVTNIEVLKND